MAGGGKNPRLRVRRQPAHTGKMENQTVDNADNEKAIREALDSLARIIIKMYQREHPLPDYNGTLPLYHGEPVSPPKP